MQIGDKVSIGRFNGQVVDVRTRKKYGLKYIQYKVLIPSIQGGRYWQPQWWFNEIELKPFEKKNEKKVSWWRRVLNYFKHRDRGIIIKNR